MVERNPFQKAKLSSTKITHIDIVSGGKCIIDEIVYSLVPDPESFGFEEDFRNMFSGRIATYMQNSLFD